MSAALAHDPSPRIQRDNSSHSHGSVTEQIEGLIAVYKDGHVERPHIVPCVSGSFDIGTGLGVVSRDMVIDKYTNLWVRFYVPIQYHGGPNKLPCMVYFHGGGFCVGSAAWSCYHHFLAKLSLKAKVVIVSVNYRLAPENPLPAAYEDGIKILKWIKQTSDDLPTSTTWWWTKRCDFANVFLAGDSAGANIAQYLSVRLISTNELEATALSPLKFKGTILIQPFFGGQARTDSERSMEEARSPLSLAASDTYWRLALPTGSDRDHPWCNPLMGSGKMECLKLRPTMVCVSEKDILRDRNLEFVGFLKKAALSGGIVEQFVYRDVGHAFQILGKSEMAKARTEEMISDIDTFILSGIGLV